MSMWEISMREMVSEGYILDIALLKTHDLSSGDILVALGRLPVRSYINLIASNSLLTSFTSGIEGTKSMKGYLCGVRQGFSRGMTPNLFLVHRINLEQASSTFVLYFHPDSSCVYKYIYVYGHMNPDHYSKRIVEHCSGCRHNSDHCLYSIQF